MLTMKDDKQLVNMTLSFSFSVLEPWAQQSATKPDLRVPFLCSITNFFGLNSNSIQI